jgi:hypothetical protein
MTEALILTAFVGALCLYYPADALRRSWSRKRALQRLDWGK